MQTPQLSFDQLYLDHTGNGKRFLVAGVDEAGRGPLAGHVVAAAVILDPAQPIDGLADSKALTEQTRCELASQIRDQALAYCVAEATVEEIDRLNILHASMLAMARAIEGLRVQPNHCLIDGNRSPVCALNCQPVVKGDALIKEISAASILAKVERDRQMVELHAQHPLYGFDRHKGYPTRQHLEAIEQHGVISEHRRSFAPVQKIIYRTAELAV